MENVCTSSEKQEINEEMPPEPETSSVEESKEQEGAEADVT